MRQVGEIGSVATNRPNCSIRGSGYLADVENRLDAFQDRYNFAAHDTGPQSAAARPVSRG